VSSKLVFTALAVVAFGGAAEAKTLAHGEVVSKFSKTKTTILYGDYWDCANLANSVYVELMENLSEEESLQNADAYFDDCMGTSSQCTPPFLC
jgi:hypothetical protein